MAVSIYFTMTDGKGDPTTREFFFDGATPYAVLIAGVPLVAALVRPLVDGGLQTAGIRIEVDIAGTWGPIAELLSDVQEQAEFFFRTALGFPTRITLPTFDEAFFNVGTSDVDLSDPAVVAFVDFMEDGITSGGGTLAPTDYREDDVDRLVTATEAWGKKRK